MTPQLERFFTDCIDVAPDGALPQVTLVATYLAWCKAHKDDGPVSAIRLVDETRAHYACGRAVVNDPSTRHSTICLLGIRLKEGG